jgi:hypothetical protein
VRSVTAPANVVTLAFDASRIAYSSGRTSTDCNRVFVWNLSTRGVTRLPRPTSCEQGSTGTAIASLAIAGDRVLWLHYTGGNIREWTLWTATSTKPQPLRLRFVARDVDAPPPLVVGDGDGSTPGGVLPYALDQTVIALRTDGARRFAWDAPARVVALSALGNEVAVAMVGGKVAVLDASGALLRTETYAGEIAAVKVTGGGGILVQRGRTLELRGVGAPRIRTLPGGARLADSAGPDRAVYLDTGGVYVLTLSSGAERLVTQGSLAQVEGPQLSAALGRQVSLRPLG